MEMTDMKMPKEISDESKIPFRYFEPASQIISRSGDICIVAKTNQWFIN